MARIGVASREILAGVSERRAFPCDVPDVRETMQIIGRDEEAPLKRAVDLQSTKR
jgi:hypothetical protein